MAKRLAITIAGAVSLGSYEAGVLYEVLDAIAQHNEDQATSANDRIKIDVITGASAGGMTAAIAAQKMLFCANEFVGPYDNPLYNVWVKRINLADLQNTTDDGSPQSEPALHSLFSSNLIEQISRDTLTARYDSGVPPAVTTHPAVAEKLLVGLALTNLNGFDYGYAMRPDGQFIYTDHQDEITRALSVADSDRREVWDELRNSAVASGAFPLAFRTKELSRNRKDYEAENLEPWDGDPKRFTYCDGGVLQNQPLGMAKNLVDEIDDHRNNESRFYLFVSPHAKGSSADPTFREGNADYFHLIKRLIGTVIGQAEFQDWVTAEELNKEIALLDTRADELARVIENGAIDIAALQKTADGLLKVLFTPPPDAGRTVAAISAETLPEAKLRIQQQYNTEYTVLGAGTPKADAWRDSVLAFEKAAGLGARDYMCIYGMAASDRVLAGSALQSFLGFFDQQYRDHDYDRGRAVARDVLTRATMARAGELGPIRYDLNRHPIRPIDARLDGLKLKDVPIADQNSFKQGTKNRVNQMLKDLIGNWSYAAKLAADPILMAVLNQLFKD